METTKPRVAVITTGGTIDSIGASRLDLAWYIEAGRRLGDGELLAAIPELEEIATIVEFPFRRVQSQAITAQDWIELALYVDRLLGDHAYDGVVITHGTNTMEETAYFLHLTLSTDKPVVLTGAMRPASALSSDGYLNLYRAVQVASCPQAVGQGVLVAMNEAIFSARDVTKTRPYRLEAFQAPDLGPLGYAESDGHVVFYHRHLRTVSTADRFDVSTLDDLPRVDVILSYGNADGIFFDAAIAAGARGIVSAGTGAGRSSPAEEGSYERAIQQGIVVCQSSRVGAGRVTMSPTVKRRGVIAADNLQPWKARILLSLSLTRSNDTETIQRMFDDL